MTSFGMLPFINIYSKHVPNPRTNSARAVTINQSSSPFITCMSPFILTQPAVTRRGMCSNILCTARRAAPCSLNDHVC